MKLRPTLFCRPFFLSTFFPLWNRRYHALGKTFELWNLSAADRALVRASPELCRGVALADRPRAWADAAAAAERDDGDAQAAAVGGAAEA